MSKKLFKFSCSFFLDIYFPGYNEHDPETYPNITQTRLGIPTL